MSVRARFADEAADVRVDTKLEEMQMPESKVLEHLNAVSTARRLANMVRSAYNDAFVRLLTLSSQELHDSDFGKREEIHKIKAAKRQRVGALKEAQSKSNDAAAVHA